MSRLGGLLRREERYTLTNPPEAFLGSWFGPRTASGKTVSETTVLGHADAYACIRVLADSAASLPIITYRRTQNGRERVPPGQNPTDALLRRPSPVMTQGVFVGTLMTHLNAWGEAFIQKRRDRPRGGVSWLGFVNPSRVEVRIERGDPVYKIAAASDDLEGDYTPAEILHIKGLSLDGIRGMSPITQAREALGLGMTLQEFASSWFANGSNPSVMLKSPQILSPEAAKRLREQWDAFHAGSRNAGRAAVLEGGMDAQTLTMSMLDAQFLEQRKLSATEIARIFRVPPWMIGADAGSSMTYSNVEQQQLAFVTHSLRPWLTTIEDHLKSDRDLFPDDESIYPEFLMDAALRADSRTRADVYALALAGKPWMTRNEVRRRENLETLDGADELDAPEPTQTPALSGAARHLVVNGASNG